MSRTVSQADTLKEELKISVGLLFLLISVFLTLFMVLAMGWSYIENQLGHMPHLYPDSAYHLDRALYGSATAIASGAGAILLWRLGRKLAPHKKE